MEGVTDSKDLERWDRMTLLLIARPRDDWEDEFEEITRREIARLVVPANEDGRDG